ncbi:MAG: winged helix-turn-helix transcriptional regulator [Bradyrhizobiaceae bacterium]|nr:winged helix-turn-helix transcriptional regulator [Bradyrhizobiaceae bacterium]
MGKKPNIAKSQPPGDGQRRGKDPRFVAPRIYTLATVLRRATNLNAKREIGLAQEGARIMILLGEFQPLTLNELAQHSALDRGQLSRGTTELVKQDLVWRERRGRNVLHRLTRKGSRVFLRLLANAEARNEMLLAGISKTDRQKLFRLMDLMTVRASELYETERRLTSQNGNLTSVGDRPSETP